MFLKFGFSREEQEKNLKLKLKLKLLPPRRRRPAAPGAPICPIPDRVNFNDPLLLFFIFYLFFFEIEND
jgi:hypothetical protein